MLTHKSSVAIPPNQPPPDLSHNSKVALAYAKAGLLVFPCKSDREAHKPSHRLPFGKATKEPLVKWSKEASCDQAKIRQWWSKWPGALVAIPCKPNKIFLVDTDRHTATENGIEGFAALCEGQEEPMAAHPVTLTEYDGEHHLFRMPDDPIPTCAIGPGIETRGFRTDNDGGYFIAAGSRMPDGRGWRRMDGTPSLARDPLPLPPQWLIDLCKPQPKPREASSAASTKTNKAEEAYAAATLDRVARELAQKAPNTGRDNLLMSVATTMGRQIACGWIGEATVAGRLFDACKANGLAHELKETEIRDKIRRGIEAGMLNPHPPLQDRPKTNGKASPADEQQDIGVTLDDFHAFMPMHSYIYAPTREMWPGSSVNARISPPAKDTKASAWLDQHRPVEQMTWAPGQPMLIAGRLISEGGWINRDGVTCFNLYRPPVIKPGDPAKAGPWLDHLRKVFDDDADHILKWLAQRVQRPADKINHALVLGGAQGIGKDTLLEPVKRAIGPWNFHEVSPQHMLGRFNGFLKSVILRVSEARDLGDIDRFQFYDHLKSYTAAPPDVLRVDEKHIREHAVLNCIGVIITTNHKTDGIYLPADDRRHFVAWSDLTKEQFETEYWIKLWRWYDNGGDRHITALLAEYDLTTFDAKAPPPKTQAFWEIVDSSRAPEDAELADVIDLVGSPAALTLSQIKARAAEGFAEWLRDRKHARQIPHRLEACGYVAVRNDGAKDGHWKVNGKRQVIYAKAELALRDRVRAAQDLAKF